MRMKWCVVLLLVVAACQGTLLKYRQPSRKTRGFRTVVSPITEKLYKSRVPILDVGEALPTLRKQDNLLQNYLLKDPTLRPIYKLARKSYNDRYLQGFLNARLNVDQILDPRKTWLVDVSPLEKVRQTKIDPEMKPMVALKDYVKSLPYTFKSGTTTYPQTSLQTDSCTSHNLYKQVQQAYRLENSIGDFNKDFNKDVFEDWNMDDLEFPTGAFLGQWVHRTNLNAIPLKTELYPSFNDVDYSIEDLMNWIDPYQQDPASLAMVYTRRVLQQVFYRRLQCPSSVPDRHLLEFVKINLQKVLSSNDVMLFNYLFQAFAETKPMTRNEANEMAYWTTKRLHETFHKDLLNLIISSTYPGVVELGRTLYSDLLQLFEGLWMPNTERTRDELIRIVNNAIERCGVSCPTRETFFARHEVAYRKVIRFFTDERRRLVNKLENHDTCTCQQDCKCSTMYKDCPCNCKVLKPTWYQRMIVPSDVQEMIKWYIYRPVAIVAEYEKEFLQNGELVMDKFGNVDPMGFQSFEKALENLQYETRWNKQEGQTMNLSFPGSASQLGRPPMSPGMQMPKLAQETDLQKMLTDERMRSQMHKTNFEQLKEEHKKLQDECRNLDEEIKRTIEESKIVQDKYKSMYEDSRRELADKHSQIEELRNKIVTPQKLDVIKMQVSEEMERSYREKYQKQEMEIEELRNSCNKLKHELFFLKSEYEHEQTESQQIVAELKLQHDAEVTNLRKEREATILKLQTEGSQDSQRVRVLQRENAQLHLKIKGLMTEMDEVRAQREKVGTESESLVRIQSKQITENQSTIKSLEAERKSLRRQVETLSRDLAGTGDAHNKLTMRIHELEKENIVYKNRADEVAHKSKVDHTNLKMEMLKQRGDLERDRDKLANLIEDLTVKLEIGKHTIQQQDQALVEKERDAVRRVQAAREEEFQKFAKVENEKLELETKIQENERRKIDEDAHRAAERDRMEERVVAALEAKDSAEKQLLVIQSKLSHQQALLDQLERERTENSELKSKVAKVETELSTYLGNEHDMTDENIRMRNQIELLNEELKLTKEQYHKAHDNHERILAQSKSALVDEKTRLELRVQELEDKLAEATKKYAKAVSVYRKYKHRGSKVIENLKYKVQIIEAKLEEAQLEKKALQACVPQDTYNNLKKQWKDLHRRHTEFRKVVLSGGVQHVPIGDMSFASINLDATALPNYSFNDQERRHQEDLKLLRQRLDLLDNNQQQQLDEFQDIAHSTLRNSLLEEDEKDVHHREKVDEEKAASTSSPIPFT